MKSTYIRELRRPGDTVFSVRRLLGGIALTMLLAGCGMVRDQLEPGRVSVRGVQPTVEQIDFAGVTAAQDNLIQALQDQAQLGGERLSYQDPRWSLVFKAGIQLINGHCDQYLDALFRFNREQRAARQDLLATGATTSATSRAQSTPRCGYSIEIRMRRARMSSRCSAPSAATA